MNRKILFILIALSLSTPAIGASTIGGVSCASWLNPATSSERIVNERWVVGFASGMNVMNSTLTTGGSDVLARFKSKQQLVDIVSDHCAQNPSGIAADAVVAMFHVLRLIPKPSK